MDEEVFYEADVEGLGPVVITRQRAVFGATTYSMANITSVSATRTEANRAIWFWIAGAGGGVAGLNWDSRNLWFWIGGCALVLALVISSLAKDTFAVTLASSSGETNALETKSAELVDGIVDAINAAMVARG